jgi:hypothetical protein
VCVAIALGIESYRTGKIVKFDPVKEKVVS